MRTIRNVPVAVIGGAGFLGSHLVEHLIEDRGCKVLVVDNLVAGRREFVHKAAKFRHHDITESEPYLKYLFEREKIRYVFNYAAFPYVPDSFARPLHVFNVNADGAIKVINAAQEAGCEGILQVSSAELYGGNEVAKDIPVENRSKERGEKSWYINENHPVAPHSTYGAAKAAVDYYCQTAWRERKTPVLALRQFNCVGERDELHPYVVPEIIGQLSSPPNMCPSKLPRVEIGVVKLGNNSFRDFMYAGDAVRIAVELLERGTFGEVYNLGNETGVKIHDLAPMIGKSMGFRDVRVEVDESRKRPWEIWHLQADCTKLKLLGIDDPRTSLEEGVEKTVGYFKSTGWRIPWRI